MKKSFLLTFAFALIAMMGLAQTPVGGEAAPASGGAEDPNAPVFKWEEETHDFGQLPQGTPATTRYYFTNTGKTDLIVENVKPTCGCTTPNWSKENIAPGQRGFVEATYNAAAPGNFNKGITVISNATTPTKMLYLKGEVLKKEEVDFHENNMLSNPTNPAGEHNEHDGHNH